MRFAFALLALTAILLAGCGGGGGGGGGYVTPADHAVVSAPADAAPPEAGCLDAVTGGPAAAPARAADC